MEHVASKLEKIGQFFQVSIQFHPCHPLIGDRKQCRYLQIVFNNKTRSLVLEFIWCKDTFYLFIKLPNSVTMPFKIILWAFYRGWLIKVLKPDKIMITFCTRTFWLTFCTRTFWLFVWPCLKFAVWFTVFVSIKTVLGQDEFWPLLVLIQIHLAQSIWCYIKNMPLCSLLQRNSDIICRNLLCKVSAGTNQMPSPFMQHFTCNHNAWQILPTPKTLCVEDNLPNL